MLRLSTTHDRMLFTCHGPPDPPLASVLEQCYWGEDADESFYVSKHNDRRLQETPRLKISDAKRTRKTRPFTAPARGASSSGISITGERMPPISRYDFDEDNDSVQSSRCSTPDFIKEIYDEYSEITKQHSLLRRPIPSPRFFASPEPTDDRVVSEKVQEAEVEPLLETPTQVHVSTNTSDFETKPLKPPRKTLKVAVDIPTCEQNEHSGNEVDSIKSVDIDLSSKPSFEELNDLSLKFKEDTEPTNEFLSFNKPKPPSKLKRRAKSAKRRKSSKNKVPLATVTVDYSQNEANEQMHKASQPSERALLKNSKEDVVTQMSRLGLSTSPNNRDSKLLLREKSAPPVLHHHHRVRRSHNHDSLKPDDNEVSSNYASRRRGRKIPIQIISDPFQCGGARLFPRQHVEGVKQQRPFSASPYVTKRQHSTSLWS